MQIKKLQWNLKNNFPKVEMDFKKEDWEDEFDIILF
jgi:hypothetical protein